MSGQGTVTCEYCHKQIPVTNSYGWIIVMYRPTRQQFLDRDVQRHLNFCSVTHLVEFYSKSAAKVAGRSVPMEKS